MLQQTPSNQHNGRQKTNFDSSCLWNMYLWLLNLGDGTLLVTNAVSSEILSLHLTHPWGAASSHSMHQRPTTDFSLYPIPWSKVLTVEIDQMFWWWRKSGANPCEHREMCKLHTESPQLGIVCSTFVPWGDSVNHWTMCCCHKLWLFIMRVWVQTVWGPSVNERIKPVANDLPFWQIICYIICYIILQMSETKWLTGAPLNCSPRTHFYEHVWNSVEFSFELWCGLGWATNLNISP